jgi:hypothetical protein
MGLRAEPFSSSSPQNDDQTEIPTIGHRDRPQPITEEHQAAIDAALDAPDLDLRPPMRKPTRIAPVPSWNIKPVPVTTNRRRDD